MSFLAAHRPNYFKFLDQNNEKAQNTCPGRQTVLEGSLFNTINDIFLESKEKDS